MSEAGRRLRFSTWLAVSLTVLVGATAVVLLVAGHPPTTPGAPPAAAPPPVQTLTVVPSGSATPAPGRGSASRSAPAASPVVDRTTSTVPRPAATTPADRSAPTPPRSASATPASATSATSPSSTASIVVVQPTATDPPTQGPLVSARGTLVLVQGDDPLAPCLALSDGAGLLLLSAFSGDYAVVFVFDSTGHIVGTRSGIVTGDPLAENGHVVAPLGATVQVQGRSPYFGTSTPRCGVRDELFFAGVTS